jgi:hypothetical protein
VEGGGRGLHAAASGNERVSAVATADQSSTLCDAQRRTVKIMIGCALSYSTPSFTALLSFRNRKNAGFERGSNTKRKRLFEKIYRTMIKKYVGLR